MKSYSMLATTPDELRDYLQKIPKVELHLHLEGAISPESIIELANRNKLRLPSNLATAENIRTQSKHYQDFRGFINALLLGVHCLRTPEDFYFVLRQLSRNLARENIVYAELTWTPQFYAQRPCGLDAILDALNQARKEILMESGIQLRWIPDLVRSYPQPALSIVNWLIRKIEQGDSGIVALGLGGPEFEYPAINFAKVFEVAAAHGLPVNPHAGENAGADSVRETINLLSPKRIGHGVRACESTELLQQLAEKKIHLEVCLTSNVCLGIYPNYEQHPLRQLLDAGCEVSLHTDDPVLFQTSLTGEYFYAITQCRMRFEELKKAILDALNASYLGEDEKKVLRKRWSDDF
jgi:adenosine deaminase